MKNQNIMFTRTIPQMSKLRLTKSFLALGIVALIMQVSMPRAQAFDLSSLNGGYADSYQVLDPATSNHELLPITAYSPYVAAALWTFDGAGGFTARLVLNIGGGIILGPNFDRTFTGTYTVNANGTGIMNWTVPSSGVQVRRHFVIGDGGRQLKYIASSTTEGSLYSGTMVKQ